jgi:hypothetical protein
VSNGGIPVKVILKDGTGKEVAQTTVNAPGTYTFSNLPPGNYTVTLNPPQGVTVKPPNPRPTTLTFGGTISGIITVEKGVIDISPPRPPLGRIILAAVSVVLLGNVLAVEEIFSLFSTPNRVQPVRVQVSPEPQTSRVNNRSGTELSQETENRLRQCLKANIQRLSGIPSLSSLVESLAVDSLTREERSKDEFQGQVLLLYKRVKELKETIEDCDPTLIQELIAVEQCRSNQEQFQAKAKIVGKMVNVRADSSLEARVIEQLPYGTIVEVDIQTLASLSEQQRLSIARGEGWYPIILCDRRRGYVYSLYIKELP